MDTDPPFFRWCHIDVDIEKQLLLLGFLEAWRSHLSEFDAIVFFTSGPALRLFLSIVLLLLGFAHTRDLFLEPIWHWSSNW